MHGITTCGRGLSHGSWTGTTQGKLSSKGGFIFCLSMLYLTFSMDKSSHPHLMLKTCLLLPSHSTAPTEFHLWFIMRRFRETCNYFLSPSPRSKQTWVITGSRSSLKMLHVYKFSLCVGGTETGPPQLLCDQGPSLTRTPWLNLRLLFAFHFSSRIYSMSLFLFSQKFRGLSFLCGPISVYLYGWNGWGKTLMWWETEVYTVVIKSCVVVFHKARFSLWLCIHIKR